MSSTSARRPWFGRLRRASWLHFVALGAALWGAQLWVTRSAPGQTEIVVSAADVARLRHLWTVQQGAVPDTATERRLIADWVDEEILFREAVARGLDKREAVVRDRLVQLARFVTEDREAEAVLEEEARSLGLERSDIVIRRHLVQTMRLLLASGGGDAMPAAAELERYYDANAARFAEPPRLRLSHIYLSSSLRGPAAADDAAQLLTQLRQQGAGAEGAVGKGDAFIRGSDLGPLPASALARIFGEGFAAAVDAIPVGGWVGPVESEYGFHLVWIRDRLPGATPPLASVRNQVLHRLLRERRAEQLAEAMRALRGRYPVRVEAPGT